MNIQNESFSDLLNKHECINMELRALNSLIVYYSDAGHNAQLAAAVDTVKRLEMSKSAIAIELDKRMTNGPTDSIKDEFCPPA